MKKTYYIIYFIVALLMPWISSAQEVPIPRWGSDSIWSPKVKSVFFNRNGIALEAPIIEPWNGSRILLEFDLLEDVPADLRYRIVHCNKDWTPDLLEPSEYLYGFEEENLNNYESSFVTLQQYIHYREYVPGQSTSFAISGNYLLIVYMQDEPDSILLTRRFYVSEELLDISMEMGKPMAQVGDYRHDQEVDVAFAPKDGVSLSSTADYYTVMLRQNERPDMLRTLPFSGYMGQQMLYRWQNENVFPGGNVFRYFDLSNIRTPMYNVQEVDRYGEEWYAFLKPMELRAHKPYVSQPTLNGEMKINVFDRNKKDLEADYVWVNFSLPMEQPYMDGSIHIVGALTDWKLDEGSRMDYNAQYKAYTKRILLKQGYYSYQLLFLPAGENVANTDRTEGNFNVMQNNYTALIYYRLPHERYDRLIGVKRIKKVYN